MTLSVVDFLSGINPSQISFHLSTTPLTTPFSLATLIEATFLGYSPSSVTITQQSEVQNQWACFAAQAELLNLSGSVIATTYCWLTATNADGTYLLWLLLTSGTLLQNLPIGTSYVIVDISAFQSDEG